VYRMIAAILAAALLVGPAAAADTGEPRDRQEDARRLLDEAAEKALRALELMIESLPQYEMPEVNEDGDIIIRRVRPKSTPPDPSLPPDGPGGTAT